MTRLQAAADSIARSREYMRQIRAKLLVISATLANAHDELIETKHRELALIEKVNAARDAMKKEGKK